MATYLHLRGASGGIDPTPVPYKALIMPGGEPYVELPYDTLRGAEVFIDARIGSMDDFGILVAVLDALSSIPTGDHVLFIPYFPGARGDRVHRGDGTALAARMFASIINHYEFNNVLVLDPHSDVTPALLDPCTPVPITEVLDLLPSLDVCRWGGCRYDALVCPDQGAEKRTAAAAKATGVSNIITARKTRDMSTGALSGFEVDPSGATGIVNGNPSLLIVDDICDGGGTFIGLAGKLREVLEPDHGKVSIDLFVTHGIFSKGIGPLLTGGINRIFTTDSFPRDRYYHLDGDGGFAGTIPIADLHQRLYDHYL